MLEKDAGTKSAHYYRKVIFNDLIESSASTITLGDHALKTLESRTNPKVDFMAMFND